MESGGVGLSSTPGEIESIPLQFSALTPTPSIQLGLTSSPAISPSVVSGPAAVPGGLLEMQTLGSCPRPAGSDPQVVLMSIGVMEPLSSDTCEALHLHNILGQWGGLEARGETPSIANPRGKWELILGLWRSEVRRMVESGADNGCETSACLLPRAGALMRSL